MTGCVAIKCRNRLEDGFRMFAIPTNIQRREKWLKSLHRERWIPSKSACVCEVHFDKSQFEKRRADGWIKLKSNAVPTIFDVHNSSLRIDGIHPHPKKVLKEVAKGNEVAATCVQEVPIISEMNIDYVAPSNHDVFNKVDVSSVSKSLSSDSGQTARENKIIEEKNMLQWEDEYLQKELESTHVVVGSSLEKENEMLRSQIDKLQSTQVVIGSSLEKENEMLHSQIDKLQSTQVVIGSSLEKENEMLHSQIDKLQSTLVQIDSSLKKENEMLRSEIDKIKTTMEVHFNSEQITKLQEGKLSHWSDESIIKGLKYRNALSIHGYNYLRSTGYPLPAYNTLCRRIQNFKINFGIFEDVLELLKFKVETMDPMDRYCILSYDEMIISAQQDYDKNNGTFSGYVTLGQNKDVLGEKIYLVLIRGIKNHWKQILACHVTQKESIDCKIIKEFIEKCIVCVENCGLYVLALSSDLDARNRSLWSSMSITIMKYVPRVNSFYFNEHDIYAREELIKTQSNWTRCRWTRCNWTQNITHGLIGHSTIGHSAFTHRAFTHSTYAHRTFGHSICI